MKKIILILFLFLSCYLIYQFTDNKELSYVAIGDTNADINYNKIKYKIYNNDYINQDYRIIDLINIIKYNEQTKNTSIHRLLKNADILIVSIGMNDIYYKLNTDNLNIYTYINNMIKDIDILLNEINKYNYKKVYFLGYYNINNKNNDLFTYLNYKTKIIVNKHNYEYIELNKILTNKPNLYKNKEYFYLNTLGYKEINKIIVENLKNYWYNIKCIYYYDLY